MSQVVIGDILPYTQATAIASQTVFGTNWTANYYTDVVVYLTPFGDAPNDATQQLTTSQFSVAFIGSQQDVQVTLVTPANAGDIITITRQTPADRENLYTNTNFTPSMLNNDFGILTLVDQQAQVVDQLIGPRYNYSATIDSDVDNILPILPANCTWVKDPNNTAIITYELPSSGIAPAGESYVLLTADPDNLPNAIGLNTIAAGFVVNLPGTTTLTSRTFTGAANQIGIGNSDGVSGNVTVSILDNPLIGGTAGMGIPSGSSAQRVIPSSGIGLRYNTDTLIKTLEYWNGSAWIQLSATVGTVIDIDTGTGLTGGPISAMGTISFAPIAANSLWANNTGATAVPQVIPMNTFLRSANNLSDLSNAATARSNLGLAIGTNVQASSAILDQIAAGTWTGATSITTLGTITTGTWNGSTITVPRGGTGSTSFSANGVILAGTSSANPLQSAVLTDGQLLIGSTGNAPVPATLTAGTNVTITNAPGSITINASGGGGLGTVTLVNSGTGLTGGPITTTGSLSLANIAAASFLANTTGGSAAPIATLLSTLLLSANNLSDVPNKATALINLGALAIVNVQTFLSSNTYFPSNNLLFALVIQCAGGGAGGGTPTAGATTFAAGAGGGGGESAWGLFTAATIGASQTITVGAGGTAVMNGTGGNGGNTSFGSLLTCVGGSGGSPGTATSTGGINSTGGNGGTGGTGGFFRLPGSPGFSGFLFVSNGVISGSGGNSGNGGGGAKGLITAGGNTGGVAANANSGGAGSGSVINSVTGINAGGGNGGSGYVYVIEFIS